MAETADAEEDSQKIANLARIRDNQRRSRARRKDYLKELETKYRNCEQIGVSASTEIQAAAKGVVEENRRLRDLLRAYGVSDAEIDGASGRQGSIAADVLEAMVNTRQACGPGDACKPILDQPHQQVQQGPYVPIQPVCHSNAAKAPTAEVHPIAIAPQYSSHMPSPASLCGSRQSDTICSPIGQGPAIHPMQGFNIPFGNPLGPPNGYGEHAMSQSNPRTDGQYSDFSSCRTAAESIRTFSPNAGYELEQELGCRAPGEECSVPNLRVFDAIDRYTARSG